MKFWLVTDTHFGHAKLVEYGRPVDFERRLFDSLSRISSEDTLIHLGDVCVGRDQDIHDKYITSLICRKWLLKGNHDNKSTTWYLNHGWHFVADSFTLRFNHQNILFSHVPRADSGYDINIHGHFHDNDHRKYEPELMAIQNEKQKLLAVEYTNYQAVTLESFLGKS